MSKGLRNFTEPRRKAVALRRMKDNTKGLGYWGAYDYINRNRIKEALQHGATV